MPITILRDPPSPRFVEGGLIPLPRSAALHDFKTYVSHDGIFYAEHSGRWAMTDRYVDLIDLTRLDPLGPETS